MDKITLCNNLLSSIHLSLIQQQFHLGRVGTSRTDEIHCSVHSMQAALPIGVAFRTLEKVAT